MDGLLVLDKPPGPTSHDVVARVRRAVGERRIGHTGTLDPSASGVLPLVLGRATRLARFLSSSDKTYQAVVRLGTATDTYDAEGAHTGTPYAGAPPSRAAIERTLDAFRGTFLQHPPAFSAKKIGGQRSYALARARARADLASPPGFPTRSAPPAPAVLPAPVSVTAHAIDVVSVDGNDVTLTIECSAGFYVRSLAHELGRQLGTGAHLAALRRLRSGDIALDHALTLDTVEREPARAASALIPLSGMLPGLAAVTLTADGVRHAGHGRDLGPGDFIGPSSGARWLRLVDADGNLVGLAEPVGAAGLLHPSVVLM
jgi:tRNA pseudouridine55 synthase